MAGSSRQNVFSPLRGKGIGAAFMEAQALSFQGILAEKIILHRGKKIFKSPVCCVLYPV